MNIILASSSPRRTEILNLANIKHLVIPSNCEEVVDEKLSPSKVVESLSLQKASSVATCNKNDIVIGADTIVTIDGLILGKPKNKIDAIKMLMLLSDRTHEVITGVTIILNDKTKTFHEKTYVTFSSITKEQIESYINEENVYDKAGSYAIQGAFCKYITSINGDYYNVMGLPIARVYKELKEFTDEIQ